jgi:L-threonylcarbamoyladenylate synthase|tara:strand:+ start:873 stop:1406 length:534 start_codon:yes stop_codon:yes gene_type:complete
MSELGSIVDALKQGKTIAYPTEGVWGLGCDPLNKEALEGLVSLKGRSLEKGLILIGSNISHFDKFADTATHKNKLLSKWPGPHTWLVPCKLEPSVLTGYKDKIALRLSNHKEIVSICNKFGGAIVSTSANKTGEPVLSNFQEIRIMFPEVIILNGSLGGESKASRIQDLITDEIIRS